MVKGLEWLKRFNKMGIGIPTVFVTAKGDPQMSIQAMQEGVFDYINRSAECAKAFPFVVNRAIEGHHLMIEKVRLQKELIEARNFLESIIDNAGDAISVVDLEGKIIYWNEGAEKIYGYRKEEVLGRQPLDFLFPQDEILKTREIKRFQGLMAQVWKGEVVSNVEVRRRPRGPGYHGQRDPLPSQGCVGKDCRRIKDLQGHYPDEEGGREAAAIRSDSPAWGN